MVGSSGHLGGRIDAARRDNPVAGHHARGADRGTALAGEIPVIIGAQIKAARALAMLEQEQLAREAGISETTLRKLEHSGHAPVPGTARTLQAVLEALNRHGVFMTAGGVELIRKADSKS
jgi:DNA-binding XRE family transcriptional regulator